MTTIGEIFKEIAPYLSTLFALWVWYTNKYDKSIKDKEELNEKKHIEHTEQCKKIQISVDNHTLLHQSHQQEREKLVMVNEQRLNHIETKLNQFDNVTNEVQLLKLKVEQYITKMDTLIDTIKESKHEQKESIKELKDLIKQKAIP